jgi:Protein of unknown function (DUF2865)
MSFGWVGPHSRSRLAVVAAAYVLGIAVAGILVAAGIHRLALALIDEPAPQTSAGPSVTQVPQRPAKQAPFSRIPPVVSQTVVGSMVPLQDRWHGGISFGSSSRGGWRSPFNRDRERNGWGDDEDRQPGYGAAFRTVCVRLCDGYYFPISFAVTQDRLERDAKVCASRCGNQGRLFVHNNPGGSAETMVDLAGRPYQQLKTAFLYRTEYVASCACQPQPWEAASQERHRGYALAQAARKGNRDAAKELQALQVKLRETAKAPEPALVREPVQVVRRDGATLMRLGGGDGPKAGAEPQPERVVPSPSSPRSESDWVRRAWQSGPGN